MTDIVKRRFFFIVIGILSIILVLCMAFWGYMRVNIFDNYDVNEEPIDTYLMSLESSFIERTQDNLFAGFIPMSVINDELVFQLQRATKKQGIVTEGIIVNTEEKWAKINYREHITIPVVHEMIIYKKKESLSIELVPIAFGENRMELPHQLNQWIFNNLIEEPIKIQLNYDAYTPGNYFNYRTSELTDEGLFLYYEFYLDDMATIFRDLWMSANEGLISIYESGNEHQQEALRMLKDHETFPENTMGLLYEDYHSDAKIIHALLVLAEPQMLEFIIGTYPMLEERIDKDDILDTRAELLNQATIKYGRDILEKLQELQATGNIASHYGYFFDLERMEPVTIELIVDLYQMKIPYEDFKQMRLIKDEDEPFVLYNTKEERYLLINEQTYSLITEEEYKSNYAYERPSKGDYTQDTETYDAINWAIEDALGEEIYIRYMKDDGVDAFVVYSSKLNYQNFDVALLKNKGKGFELIDRGLTSISQINEQHPDFNLNLITRRIETTEVEILNSSTRQAIIEGLIEYGYIDEDEIIPYISYDGKRYIAVMTGSGQQFIYTIYRDTFLERVYTLEEALELFDDINPLLLIQKRPVN